MPKERRRSANIEFDYKKAAPIFGAIIEAWLEGRKDFALHEPPERKLRPAKIKERTREHAVFLFACAHFSRSGQTADQAIGKVANIAENYFELLDPACDPDPILFQKVMLPAFPFNQREKEIRLQNWIRCRENLRVKYNSDPRNIFLGINCSDPIVAREAVLLRLDEDKDFPGIGHKIAQLMAQWFQEVDWPEEKDFWREFSQICLTAADVWLMRMVYQLGLVTDFKNEHRDSVALPVSNAITKVCRDNELDHKSLIQALWHIGSRICNFARKKNDQERGLYCNKHCPASKFCVYIVPANREKRGRGSIFWSEAVPKNDRELYYQCYFDL